MAYGATWFVAAAAVTLIMLSVGSYFYHRRQLDSIATRYLRLVVAGPGQLQAGMPSRYDLLATTVTGEPLATAPVDWSLSTADGRPPMDHQGPTDEQGRLTMVVPADMDLPRHAHEPAQLSVTLGGSANPSTIVLPLPIEPERYLTRLWLDRRSYRPGDTVYYRSLTLSRYGLAAGPTLPVEFEILEPNSPPLPGSRVVGLTDHGVGNGSFRLPDGLAAGVYTLVARGAGGIFPAERLAFEVAGPAKPPTPASAAGTTGTRVEFFPEGGRLAVGIENRVYFAARDAKGQPLEIRGEIVDSREGQVTEVESTCGGLGVFRIVPNAAETYRLKIAGPKGVNESPLLPPASVEQKVAISVPRGIIAAGEPLEFSIRAAKDRLPLVVAASVRGMPVGQRMVVTLPPDLQAKERPLSMPLDDQVAGLICLTVYDFARSPPQVLAERFVYRQPRRLIVRAAEKKPPASGYPGKSPLALVIENERGRPVAAAAGVTVLRAGDRPSTAAGKTTANEGPPARCGPDLFHAFLCDANLEGPPGAGERRFEYCFCGGRRGRRRPRHGGGRQGRRHSERAGAAPAAGCSARTAVGLLSSAPASGYPGRARWSGGRAPCTHGRGWRGTGRFTAPALRQPGRLAGPV